MDEPSYMHQSKDIRNNAERELDQLRADIEAYADGLTQGGSTSVAAGLRRIARGTKADVSEVAPYVKDELPPCPACGYAQEAHHICLPGTNRLKRGEKRFEPDSAYQKDEFGRQVIQYDAMGYQLPALLNLDTYIQEGLIRHFEKYAEDWWAKRLRDARWQEDQDRVNALWGNHAKPPWDHRFIENDGRKWSWGHDGIRMEYCWIEQF